jgi:hypothetical protein
MVLEVAQMLGWKDRGQPLSDNPASGRVLRKAGFRPDGGWSNRITSSPGMANSTR